MNAQPTTVPIVPARLAYDPVEAGELLSVSRTTIYELMACGQLPYLKVGRVRRIRHEALVAYLDRLAEQLVARLSRIGSTVRGRCVVSDVGDRPSYVHAVGPQDLRGMCEQAELRWADWFLVAVGVERAGRVMRLSRLPGRRGARVDLASHGPALSWPARRWAAERLTPRPAPSVVGGWAARLLERGIACAERLQARRRERQRRHARDRSSGGR